MTPGVDQSSTAHDSALDELIRSERLGLGSRERSSRRLYAQQPAARVAAGPSNGNGGGESSAWRSAEAAREEGVSVEGVSEEGVSASMPCTLPALYPSLSRPALLGGGATERPRELLDGLVDDMPPAPRRTRTDAADSVTTGRGGRLAAARRAPPAGRGAGWQVWE